MYFHTIDIAHPPLSSDRVEEVLDDEITQIRFTQKWRVLKVIHGHNDHDRISILKRAVHNWAYRNRTHLRGVIPGEEYHMYDPATQELRKICGQVQDPDFGATNTGMTLIWIK
jgi:hypothetical protein